MKFQLLLVIPLMVVFQIGKAQGCSDAGICSINGCADENKTQAWNAWGGQTAELGENKVIYFHTSVGVSVKVSPSSQFSFSVPFRNILYKSEMFHGLGDGTLAYSIKISERISLTSGLKIPFSQSDKKDKNANPLPMAFQSGLGTFDGILSIGYKWNIHKISLGYQHVFGTNDNGFLGNDLYENFNASARFNRGDDIMLRYDRRLSKDTDKWRASLISVYRIQSDRILDSELVEDSKGLSLNVAFFRQVKLGKRNLEFMLAAPLIARKVRADGLTRNVIAGVKLTGLLRSNK